MSERDYDVIVYGAGPEGVAAALAAAERSAKVLLADECADVGGSAVCGLLNRWHGDDAGAALSEQVRALTRRAWGRLIFEPEEMARVFRGGLSEAGVDLLLGAKPVRAKAARGRVGKVSFAGRGGRVKLAAWCYVDASQDFLLARLAGCRFGGGDAVSVSLHARVGGIDTRVPGVFDAETLSQYTDRFRAEQAVEDLPRSLGYPALTPCLRGGTAILDASPEGVPVPEGPLGLTQAAGACREHALAAIGFLQRNVPGYENCHLIHYAAQPLYVDTPRPIRRRPDAPGENGALEDAAAMAWRDPGFPGDLVSVKLGNLMSPDAGNLLLARADGIDADALPLLLLSGETAGRVAAESLLYDGDIVKLDGERLRRALGAQSH